MSHWEEGLVPSKINHRESSSFQKAFQKHWVLRAGNVFQIILPISSLELEKKKYCSKSTAQGEDEDWSLRAPFQKLDGLFPISCF